MIADLANQGIADGIINVTNIKSASYAPSRRKRGRRIFRRRRNRMGRLTRSRRGNPVIRRKTAERRTVTWRTVNEFVQVGGLSSQRVEFIVK